MTPVARRRVLARATLVAVGLVAALLALAAIRPVHDRAVEASWLRDHAGTASYSVVELGELRDDGAASAVWVSQPGGRPPAFVDLAHSSQEVTAVGQRVRARIDDRDAPAAGSGLAADAVGRSFLADYLEAGWPLLLTAACAAGLLLLRRRPAWVPEAASSPARLSR